MLEVLAGPVLEVAPLLLGAELTHAGVTVRLTEVEAYAGADDPASHAFRGRTARTATMFGPAGHLYVYRSYGLHWCANVVTGEDGTASAVLLRAGEVTDGIDLARERRGPVRDAALARGPGCLTRALGLTGGDDGTDLAAALRRSRTGAAAVTPERDRDPADPGVDAPAVLVLGPPVPHDLVATGPRVGVSTAHARPWRFWLRAEPSVSTYRRSPRADPATEG